MSVKSLTNPWTYFDRLDILSNENSNDQTRGQRIIQEYRQ